jgi:hypothetical protein
MGSLLTLFSPGRLVGGGMAALSAALLAGELGTKYASGRAAGDEAGAEDGAGELVRSMVSTSFKVSLAFLFFFFLDLGVFILSVRYMTKKPRWCG